MDPLNALLIGVVAPGALALAIVALGRRAWRDRAPMPAAWSVGVGLAAGYALAFALIIGWPALPPVDVTHWAAWLALLGAGLGAAPLGGRPSAAAWRLGGTLAIGVAVGLALTDPLAGRVLSGGEQLLYVVAIAATIALLDQGLARGLVGAEPRGAGIAMTAFVGGAAAVVLMSDVASLAQATGALAAGLGALTTLALWRPGTFSSAAASPVVALVVGATLWSALLYANGRLEAVAALVAAPLALWAARGVLARRRGRFAWILPALVIALPVGLAAGVGASSYFGDDAAPSHATPSDGDSDDGGGVDDDYGYGYD